MNKNLATLVFIPIITISSLISWGCSYIPPVAKSSLRLGLTIPAGARDAFYQAWKIASLTPEHVEQDEEGNLHYRWKPIAPIEFLSFFTCRSAIGQPEIDGRKDYRLVLREQIPNLSALWGDWKRMKFIWSKTEDPDKDYNDFKCPLGFFGKSRTTFDKEDEAYFSIK